MWQKIPISVNMRGNPGNRKKRPIFQLLILPPIFEAFPAQPIRPLSLGMIASESALHKFYYWITAIYIIYCISIDGESMTYVCNWNGLR